jgi:putative transcriptional regulator
VAHLNAAGSLLDATYLGTTGVDVPDTLSLAADGTVLLSASFPQPPGVDQPTLAQIRFGAAGWSASPCLSPAVLHSATFAARDTISPGQLISHGIRNRSRTRADRDAQPLTESDIKRMRRTPQAKIIRRALDLTQEEFAARYHIPLGTLRDWEQGRAEPDQPTRAYLTLIARDPDHVNRILNPKAS